MTDMNQNPFEQLKNEYQQIPIPKELDNMIKQTIEQDKKESFNKKRRPIWQTVALTAAAVTAVFIGSINLSPTIATALGNVPLLGALVEVCTFRGYSVDENNFQAEINIPQVNGLDAQITDMLNQKYLAEGAALYETFQADMEAIKEEFPDAHMGLDYDFEVKTNNDTIFSLCRYIVNTVGSSSTIMRFDTVDKTTQQIIALPDLFAKDSDYVSVISANIAEQMREQMATDDAKVYWIDNTDFPEDNFKAIAADQQFFINEDYQLVISFDKYEVAPGYMGIAQFVIPTDVLAPILTEDSLLK